MRHLKIDLEQLSLAFESIDQMMKWYLDLETGEVILVTLESHDQLEEIYADAMDDEGNLPEDFAGFLQTLDLPEWQRAALVDADRIEGGFGERYVAIPQEDTHVGYRDMERFIDTVEDRRLQTQLEDVIRERGAFRRFRDRLHDVSSEWNRWHKFRDERAYQRMLEWLEELEIEVVDTKSA